MGYFKDNFPGSAAQLQRRKLARGVVAYALLAGSAIFFFSPFSKLLKEEFKKGSWDTPQWHKERSELLREGFLKTRTFVAKNKLEEILEDSEADSREDFTGPSLHKEIQAYKRGLPVGSGKNEPVPKNQ